MRSILTLCAMAVVLTTAAFAETYSGKLVDASCLDQQKGQPNAAESCNPGSSTTAFALVSGSNVFKLDDAGNAKAAEALKARADRSAPGSTASTAITAKIAGEQAGDKLKVSSIEVQ